MMAQYKSCFSLEYSIMVSNIILISFVHHLQFLFSSVEVANYTGLCMYVCVLFSLMLAVSFFHLN